jgi:UDP-N-acetyl-alpha-D-quinovosamine dehydrogenase
MAPTSDEILVTGAAGFIGAALVESLLRQGRAVRAAVRAPAARHAGQPRVREVIVPDLASCADWRPLLEGVTTIVHLAGAAHRPPGADAALFESANALATERLASAAARAGVKRFVFVSSAKVNGDRSPGRPFSEDDPADPADGYARSKLEAERRLHAAAASGTLEPVVLRPPLVYGPGVKANFLALMRLVDSGLPLPVAGIRNRRSLVYVGNLVSAIGVCLAHPLAAGRTFFVADAEAVSTPGLAAALARALERPVRQFAVPAPLLHAAAALAGRRAALERLSGSLELDTTRIRSLLGWRPPHAFAEGVADTCRWFRIRA